MWNVCVNQEDKFTNIEKIFPTQQKDVSSLVNVLKKNPVVKKIVIFGSSVTSACNPWSDIDAYVELSEDCTVRSPRFAVPVDLWTNYDVDEHLLQEISEKGVVVYEK